MCACVILHTHREQCFLHVFKLQTRRWAPKDGASPRTSLLACTQTHSAGKCLWVCFVIIKWQMTLWAAATLKWNVFFKAGGNRLCKYQSKLRKFRQKVKQAQCYRCLSPCFCRAAGQFSLQSLIENHSLRLICATVTFSRLLHWLHLNFHSSPLYGRSSMFREHICNTLRNHHFPISIKYAVTVMQLKIASDQ